MLPPSPSMHVVQMPFIFLLYERIFVPLVMDTEDTVTLTTGPNT